MISTKTVIEIFLVCINKTQCVKLRWIYIIQILFISNLKCGELVAQDFQNTHFSTVDGLPSNTVYSCFQDNQGYIWMTTEYGVSRFDGFRFQNFSQEDGLSDNDVFKIYQDRKQRIWFLMSNGTLSYYLNGRFFNPTNDRTLENAISKSYFNSILEDAEGTIWISTYADGVYLIKANKTVQHLRPLIEVADANLIPGLWLNAENEVHTCGKGGIINLSRKPGLYETPFTNPQWGIEIAYGKMDGSVLIASNHHLFQSTAPGRPFIQVDSSAFTYDRIVSHMQEDRDGNLWITTLNGLHLFENSILKSENHHKYFHDHTLSGCMIDQQDNLWITSLNDGIYLVNDRKVTHYSPDFGSVKIPVTTLFKSKDGIWLGNDRGELSLLKNNKLHKLPSIKTGFYYGRGRVRSFQKDPRNETIWMVSENGLFQIKNGKVISHFPSGAKSICFDKEDHIIIGSLFNANLYKIETIENIMTSIRQLYNQNKMPYNKMMELMKREAKPLEIMLPTTRVYAIKQDQENTIWFATNTGLYSRQYGKTLYHKPFDALLGKSFQSMEILNDGTIALGCNGYGVFLLKNRSVTIVNNKNGLSSNYIKSLHQFGNDSLWVSTPNGLNLVVIKEGSGKPLIKNWTKANGLISDDILDMVFSKDTAFIASSEGLSIYPGFGKKKYYTRPPIKITRILANSILLTSLKKIEVPEKNNQIDITFINLDFRNLKHLQYHYRLNTSSAWIPVRGNEIHVGSLTSGSYVVEIQANIPGDGWTIPQKLIEISISQPFYENPVFVFFIVCALVAGMLVFLYVNKLAPQLARTKKRNENSILFWKEEQSVLVLSALNSIQELIATNQNDIGILYVSRFRKFYTYLMEPSKANIQSIKDEAHLLKMYVDMISAKAGFQPEILFNKKVLINSESILIPSLILVKTLDLAFSIVRIIPSQLSAISIGLVEIGDTIQLNIELPVQINQDPLSAKQLKSYHDQKINLQNLVNEWNQFNYPKIDFLAPDGFDGRPLTNRIQIWILKKGRIGGKL